MFNKENAISFILIYLIIINLLGCLINIVDKIKAKHNKWRIRESTLWITALLGGAFGSYATMKLIRHKTMHKSFMIDFPILIIIQSILIIYICTT